MELATNITNLIAEKLAMERDMENGKEVNGGLHTPRNSSLNGFSLTEYTANPSPPREGRTSHGGSLVPADFRSKDGHPDVW